MWGCHFYSTCSFSIEHFYSLMYFVKAEQNLAYYFKLCSSLSLSPLPGNWVDDLPWDTIRSVLEGWVSLFLIASSFGVVVTHFLIPLKKISIFLCFFLFFMISCQLHLSSLKPVYCTKWSIKKILFDVFSERLTACFRYFVPWHVELHDASRG